MAGVITIGDGSQGAFQHHGQARHDPHDQPGLCGDLLVQPPLMIPKGAGQRVVGHDAAAHLVRHDDDGGGTPGKGMSMG